MSRDRRQVGLPRQRGTVVTQDLTTLDSGGLGGQQHTVVTIPASYDPVAEQYDLLMQHGKLIHGIVLPPLLELAGSIVSLDVCDLACGTGVVARALAEHGARVVGVDVSPRMLAIARRYEQTTPLGIRYSLDHAHTLTSLKSASLDLVICNLALTDIPDPLEALAMAVGRVLRPGGAFVFSIPHPCFQAPGSSWLRLGDETTVALVRGYFDEGFWQSSATMSSQQFSGCFGGGGYHRTLSSLLNTLTQAGLLYERAIEPKADEKPGYQEAGVALLVRCCKQTRSGSVSRRRKVGTTP